jgi:hypothetical protein
MRHRSQAFQTRPIPLNAKPATKISDAKITKLALRSLRSFAAFVFKIPYMYS